MNEYDFGLCGAGLCGGMSFGSCDYFNAQNPIPPEPDQRKCDKLRDDLLFFFALRQAASLRHPVFRKFFQCMIDNKYRADETNNSFQFLKLNLKPKMPFNLCLIRTDKIVEAANNHQVLAYKLCEPEQNLFEIHTYDPNEPRDSGMIIFVTIQSNKVVKLSQDIDYDQNNSPLLGFFVNEVYVQEPDPPEIII
jgi:hypothetical protein